VVHIEQKKDSIVMVHTTRYSDFVPYNVPKLLKDPLQTVTGTGFFVAPGLVMTNHHVVAQCKEGYITMQPSGHCKFPYSIMSMCRAKDLAVIRIHGTYEQPPILEFNTDFILEKGKEVISYGHAAGIIDTVMTRGVISGWSLSKATYTREGHVNNFALAGYPRTSVVFDAAVNPGNSGGALVNLNG
jgi:S1-C subfamily serine protease